MAVQVKKKYLLGDYELEPDKRLLCHRGTPIPLAPKPFRVLLYLIEHHDRLVTRQELLEQFWDGHKSYDLNLTKCVGAVRKALDDPLERPRFIETLWTEGYRYIGPLEEQLSEPKQSVFESERKNEDKILEEVNEENRATKSKTFGSVAAIREPRRFLKTHRDSRTLALLTACLLVALTAGALISYRYYNKAGTVPPGPIRSIAVLPLRNLTGDATSEYFSDGMTESLIMSLSKIGNLNVISHGSVFRFKGKEVDPQAAGRQLGVDAVLEGSVRKDGDSVRVSVRLVGVDDGRVLWASENYHRGLRDIFALQGEIARNVATELKFKLGVEAEQDLTKRYTENVEAYELYWKGRYFWNKRTEEGLRKAIEYFEQAIAKDQNYALAYAGLADSYNLLGDYGYAPAKEALSKAKETALKALKIDDSLTEAHTSLAFVRAFYDWDWAGAEKEFQRAIELNPNYATAYHWYGLLLAAMGRFDEAVVKITQARKLDPYSLIINANLGRTFYFARQHDRAIEQLLKVLEMDPDFSGTHFKLAAAYAAKGMETEAIAEYQKYLTLFGESKLSAAIGKSYATNGYKGAMKLWLESLKEEAKRHYVSQYAIALAALRSGDKEQALEWLEKAYQERSSWLVYLKVEPEFNGLHSDPRFQDLLQRVGFSK
jgi:TolB-like protein/DNA-binding winged helix-turn-helix (wHTH) protein/Tfp pilus assembly protein PilF